MRIQALRVLSSALALLAGAPIAGHAATFAVSVTGNGLPIAGPPQVWEPLPGLFAAMSLERDLTFSDISTQGDPPVWYIKQGTGLGRAAVYGSDISVKGGVLDPRMDGYAVEPMADVAAALRLTCTGGGSPIPCPQMTARAHASARVDHRIVPRDPSDLPIAAGEKVPVILDYALHAGTAAPPTLDLFRSSQSFAGFSVLLGDEVLFGRRSCSMPGMVNCTSIGDESGSWSAGLDYTSIDHQTTYAIAVRADATASLWSVLGGGTAGAEAVADPFLRIDPGWQYASYFMVQQESVLHTGEWFEVSRAWTQPVPEPGRGALFILGLAAAWVTLKRRDARSAALRWRGDGQPLPNRAA